MTVTKANTLPKPELIAQAIQDLGITNPILLVEMQDDKMVLWILAHSEPVYWPLPAAARPRGTGVRPSSSTQAPAARLRTRPKAKKAEKADA
jgi:hypothetical protein